MIETKKTILLYGRTNSGKTAQIGVLAKHIWKTYKKRTRLYTADRGGIVTVDPYVQTGIIEPVLIGNENPWIFLNKAVNGFVKNEKGLWQKGDLSEIGLVAFESFRSFAEELLMWLADQSAQGVSIGGGSNISFEVKDGDEKLKVGGSNMAHYKVVQDRMTKEIWQSQKLDVPWILWTSSVSKEESGLSTGKILGPDVIGKALTEEVPRWFTWTFRLDVLPAKNQDAEKHILYLGTTTDVGAGNATGLGNLRMALGQKLTQTQIEPADIVKAIQLVEAGSKAAVEALRKELG